MMYVKYLSFYTFKNKLLLLFCAFEKKSRYRNRVDFFFNYLTCDFQKYQEYERDCFIQSLLNIFG